VAIAQEYTQGNLVYKPDSLVYDAPLVPLPLGSIRVVELGSLIAGPFAGRLLTDFGAEVIKVEAPDKPDPLRS
jgi:hypothetical protein